MIGAVLPFGDFDSAKLGPVLTTKGREGKGRIALAGGDCTYS